MRSVTALAFVFAASCRSASPPADPPPSDAPNVLTVSTHRPEADPVAAQPLSAERLDMIGKLANDEWVDDVEPDLDEAAFDELSDEWARKTDAFFAADTSPAELHAFAKAWNWDGGTERMRDVIEHPNCDAGTALLVYWYASPQFYSVFASRDDVPEWARDTYDLIVDIEGRYLRGAYKTTAIAYDPKADGMIAGDIKDPILRPIPARMYVPVKGR